MRRPALLASHLLELSDLLLSQLAGLVFAANTTNGRACPGVPWVPDGAVEGMSPGSLRLLLHCGHRASCHLRHHKSLVHRGSQRMFCPGVDEALRLDSTRRLHGYVASCNTARLLPTLALLSGTLTLAPRAPPVGLMLELLWASLAAAVLSRTRFTAGCGSRRPCQQAIA
jgi:hypothetical protein